MSILSYVFGILSIALNWLLCWLPVASQVLCMALGIAAIVLGGIGIAKGHPRRGLAIAGIILGAIGLLYGVIALFARGLAALAVKREMIGMDDATLNLIKNIHN